MSTILPLKTHKQNNEAQADKREDRGMTSVGQYSGFLNAFDELHRVAGLVNSKTNNSMS